MGIGAAGDREQRMHTTVRATLLSAVFVGADAEVSVRIHQPLESRLDNRAIRVQKRNLCIVDGACAVRGNRFGIDVSARTAYGWKAMAARAAVQIEARTKPFAG